MARIRVLVADVSRVLRDIIDTTLSSQPDMEVALAAELEHPDIVVVGLRNADVPEPIEGLFQRFPGVRVLGIVGDGRQAYMYELRPHRSALGELSPEQLVQVIRQAGAADGVTGRTPSWGR